MYSSAAEFICHRAAILAPLALLGRVRRNQSGAAQAARCLTYPVQFHLSVEPISPHDVVVHGLRADWGELAPTLPGCLRSTACVTGPLAGRNRSGAAQAARCLAYPVQFHLNVEPLSPHDVVVLGLHADWGELAKTLPGCLRSSACVTGLLAQLRLRYWAV